jgi:tetratricopeptide (TPR) repeat protein
MMRYLFGPVSSDFSRQYLQRERQTGACLDFDTPGAADLAVGPGDSWEGLLARLPDGWRPDCIVLYPAYRSVPAWLWSVPVPLVALAPDWNLLWHRYSRLRCCERVHTDRPGVDVLTRAGIGHARAANLFACEQAFLDGPWEDVPKDIDILFTGNLHPAVQRERLAWLGRLARLGRRWRVALRTGVFGADYRRLLGRARIVWNRGIRGEANRRVFEAAAAGALLFQEADNAEVAAYFRPGTEYVPYDAHNLEERLEYFLTHEDERRAIAEAARSRVREHAFEDAWQAAVARLEQELPELVERVRQRPVLTADEDLHARTWQALSSSDDADPALVADLTAAVARVPGNGPLHHALGLALARAAQGRGPVGTTSAAVAVGHFRRALACDPSDVVAGLNLAEALVGLEQRDDASETARRTLATLDRLPELPAACRDAGHFPPAFDLFRVEWQRAAWAHAGDPDGEARAKRALLRWRLHALLADLTGALPSYYEAAQARPDLPTTQAALGCALGRAGHYAAALPHLRDAVAQDPFDRDAARALAQVLEETGDLAGRRRLARDRRLLVQAAPQAVPPEAWFAEAAPVGDELASVLLLCCNEVEYTRQCLDSVRRHTRPPYELILVDNGSTDGTPALLEEVRSRPGPERVEVIRNETNVGFPAGCNQALARARGDYLVLLNNDTVVTPGWLDGLVGWALHDWPTVGLVGAVTNCSRAPQEVAVDMKGLCLSDPASPAATVVDHVRLFRNRPDVRWQYRVHEQILPAVRRSGGEVRWSDVVIRHVGYQDPALRRRKLDRDLRLLGLEDAEHPDDPFTLFNLGSVYQELGRPTEALAVLRRSLERSHPRDSIVRKLYALIVQGERGLGQRLEALAACQTGRGLYPDDSELLFAEGVLRRELGDPAGAEACLRRLLEGREGEHFASVDTGLRGYKARHNLAVVYQEQQRLAEAEAPWRAAVVERGDFQPAWLGLGEVYLTQQRWPELDEIVGRLSALPDGETEAATLRARGHLARRQFGRARAVLQGTIARHPEALRPRVLLSPVLLQEGQDWPAAEQALHGVLRLAPNHAEARRNLEVLRRQRAAVRS